jgi:hypothetical protein
MKSRVVVVVVVVVVAAAVVVVVLVVVVVVVVAVPLLFAHAVQWSMSSSFFLLSYVMVWLSVNLYSVVGHTHRSVVLA